MVHFSGNVANSIKEEILNILNMQECCHNTKNLGAPFCNICSKKDAFLGIIKKGEKKIRRLEK